MKPVVIETEVAAPPAHVFSVFTDLARAPGRVRAIEALEVLTPGPFGKGTRFQETRRIFGRSSSETMEVVEFRPGQGYALAAEASGTRFRSSFDFEPSGAGTRVRLTLEATPVSAAARMMGPMMGLMAASLEKAIRADLEDLQAACEGRARPA